MVRKRGTLFIFLLSWLALWANAQEKAPVAVSPSSDVGIATVGQVCPTFSWTAVEGAVAYRVEVFKALEGAVPDHKDMAIASYPVLVKEILGTATSWTPSSDQSLSDEGVYVWYVQAIGESGAGTWSRGRTFQIEAAPGLAPIIERVRNALEEHGVDEEIITDAIGQMDEAARTGRARDAYAQEGPNPISIQGYEGIDNTLYGVFAGQHLEEGALYNSFFGVSAGQNTTSGTANTFLGHTAGFRNYGGLNNTAVGYNSGYNLTAGQENTLVGYASGYGIGGSGNTGYDNTYIGFSAGHDNSSGYENTIVGSKAGYSNQGGDGNTCLGFEAGYTNHSGNHNTFLGYQAGKYDTASGNVFIGAFSGDANTNGYNNTLLGFEAGSANTTGRSNTFIGYKAGLNNIDGNYNTVLGREAGFWCKNGSYNVFLGHQAGFNETGSNRLYIDSSSIDDPLIYGEFDNDVVGINGWLGIGTKSPDRPMHLKTTGLNSCFLVERAYGATNYMNATANFGNFGTVSNHPLGLTVNSLHRMVLWSDNSVTLQNGASCTSGGVWTDASSRNLKENINALTSEQALDALEGLQPVTYNYKADKEEGHVGFIAEDVPDLVASKDRKGMSPMDVVAVLTKVLQEQQQTIDDLRQEITELKVRVQQQDK
jgi:hypothetical protein